MFSLKFDLLFPTIVIAKAAARKLNTRLKRSDTLIEPRELHRIQQERIRYKVTAAGRLFGERTAASFIPWTLM